MLIRVRRAKSGLLLAAPLLALGFGSAIAEVMQRRDWNVDASQGSFSSRVEIIVPAFHGIAPKLSLKYDSSVQGGWMGAGWTLAGPSRIERASAGRGAPKYDANDIYLLDGQELVPCAGGSVSPSCTTGGTHSTKTENYSRIALSGSGTSATWTITAKDGTRSVFSPIYLVSGGTQVFKWGLSQVIDTKGNTVTYAWAVNQFACCWEYPDQITYNGTTVKFYFETRPDNDWGALGSPGFTTQWGRLKTVDVKVSGNRVRAYKLSYTSSGSTNKSLLGSVQQFGKDATVDASGTVTGGTSLPAISMTYQAGSTSFVAGNNDTSMPGNANSRYLAMDINGDGKTDMLELYPILTEYYRRAWISNGTSFSAASNVGGLGNIGANANTRFLAADVNGDGKSDFIELYPPFLNLGNWKRHVWVSNGTGFTSGNDTATSSPFSLNARQLAMDVNGDGKTDFVELYQSGVTYQRVTWISNGTSFTQTSSAGGIGYNTTSQFLAMDVNGDNKQDLVELYNTGLGTWGRHIWLSNGTGFTSGATDTSMVYSTGGRYLAADINGDGKTDMLELFPYLGAFYRRAWLSNGYGFTQASSDYGLPADDSTRFVVADVNGDSRDDFIELYLAQRTRRIWLSTSNGGFTLGATDVLGINADTASMHFSADVNGDGLGEMIELYPAVLGARGRRIWSIGGSFPDLLSSISDTGGTTTVGYTPSSAWANTNNPPIMQTVSAVTVADGRGNSGTTSYTYSGGLYDFLERRFMGFRYEKETRPCIAGESQCPYTESWLKQDYGSASKPERIDRRTGSGQLLSSSLYDYTTNGSTVPWTSLQTGSWEYTYINAGTACPGADCKRKYTGRAYNAYGEVTQETVYGDYDTSGDEDTAATTYVPNTTAYVVNKPADVKVHQGIGTAGTLLKETLTYYDGATTWNQAPSAGLPTKVARWLSSPSSFVEKKKEYDAWGNVTADENEIGARMTYTYDATYHLFRTGDTNAVGQTTSATWDAVCGGPTTTTNLNGKATTLTYDALCRIATKTEPGGRFENHSWVNLGNGATQYEQVDRPAADGTGSALWSRTYFDGLGRKWRTVSKGPDAATGDIYVDTTYNARNQEASRTAPYYWVSGQAQPTTYSTTFSYDALDRVTRQTYADGVYKSKSYGLWSTTETDELGRARTDRVNAAGNRTGHDETVGGQIKTTTYAYDARQNLLSSTDTAGNVTTYTTDSLGRRTQMVDPDLGMWTYAFDGASRMTSQTDSKGQVTTFGYDALDRKTSKTSNAGTGSAVTVTWTYDEVRSGYYNVGFLTTMTDPAGSKTSDRDLDGRVVRNVRIINGATYTFQHGFDAGDRLLWTTYPDGGTLGTPGSPLTYDSAGRPRAIPGYVTAALYNAEGKLTQVTAVASNGTVSTRTYSPQRGWLTGISTTKGATTIQNLAYTRNAKGMITGVTSPFAGEGWTYAFDELDRLTTATNTSNSAYNQTLAYSAIGNITSNSRLGAYTYGSKPHAPLTAGGNTYAYDAGGNVTSVSGGTTRTLTWDGDNRIATVVGGGTSLAMTYDADGARVQQVENGVTRHYVGDDYEVQVGGSAIRYVSLPGAVVARLDGSTATFVHTDQQGSIQAETDAAGAEVHRRVFRPFGEVISTSGSVNESRGYTGQRHDASGLVYLHARYYDPVLAAFASPDMIIDGTDTIGLNRFAYCANDPVNRTDTEGTDSKDNNTGDKKPKTGNWVDRAATAAKNNDRFAKEVPTIGEAGQGKVRYEFYQHKVGVIGSHFKVNVYDDKNQYVSTYSLNQEEKKILGVNIGMIAGGTKYNDTNPALADDYKLAGTVYKDASSLQSFNNAYMNVVAPGGKAQGYSLGDSNKAMNDGLVAIGETKGLFTLANPTGTPAASFGFDNNTGGPPPAAPAAPAPAAPAQQPAQTPPGGGGGSF